MAPVQKGAAASTRSAMLFRFAKIAPSFALLAMLLFACGNEGTQAGGPGAAAQDSTAQPGPLLETNAAEVEAAKNNLVQPIAPADLLAAIKSDTAAALVVNFWKVECLKCLYFQQNLQLFQSKYGTEKLHVLSVNLDGEDKASGVNLILQKLGITAAVKQVQGTDVGWRNDISGGWQGNVPAIFVKLRGGAKQFITRPDLTAEELEALLKPMMK
jgi:thiol-disulfide isomerase/thioredoxin